MAGEYQSIILKTVATVLQMEGDHAKAAAALGLKETTVKALVDEFTSRNGLGQTDKRNKPPMPMKKKKPACLRVSDETLQRIAAVVLYYGSQTLAARELGTNRSYISLQMKELEARGLVPTGCDPDKPFDYNLLQANKRGHLSWKRKLEETLQAISDAGGNKTAAARALGVSSRTVSNHLRKAKELEMLPRQRGQSGCQREPGRFERLVAEKREARHEKSLKYAFNFREAHKYWKREVLIPDLLDVVHQDPPWDAVTEIAMREETAIEEFLSETHITQTPDEWAAQFDTDLSCLLRVEQALTDARSRFEAKSPLALTVTDAFSRGVYSDRYARDVREMLDVYESLGCDHELTAQYFDIDTDDVLDVLADARGLGVMASSETIELQKQKSIANPRPNKLSEDILKDTLGVVEQSSTLAVAAEVLGLSESGVYHRLAKARELGVTLSQEKRDTNGDGKIEDALAQCHGNPKRTAKKLGVNINTVRKFIKDHPALGF